MRKRQSLFQRIVVIVSMTAMLTIQPLASLELSQEPLRVGTEQASAQMFNWPWEDQLYWETHPWWQDWFNWMGWDGWLGWNEAEDWDLYDDWLSEEIYNYWDEETDCPDCDYWMDLLADAYDSAADEIDNIEFIEDMIDDVLADMDELEQDQQAFRDMVTSSGGHVDADCDGFQVTSGKTWGVAHRFGEVEFCFDTESDLETFIDKLHEWNKNNSTSGLNEGDLTAELLFWWDLLAEKEEALDDILDLIEILEEILADCLAELAFLQWAGLCPDDDPIGSPPDPDPPQDPNDPTNPPGGAPGGPSDDGSDQPGWPTYPDPDTGEDVPCPDCEEIAEQLDAAEEELEYKDAEIDFWEDYLDSMWLEWDELQDQKIQDFIDIVHAAGGKTNDDCDGFDVNAHAHAAAGSYQRFGGVPYCFDNEPDIEDFIERLKQYDRDHNNGQANDLQIDIIFIGSLLDSLYEQRVEAQDWYDFLLAALEDCEDELAALQALGLCLDVDYGDGAPPPSGLTDIAGNWAEAFIQALFDAGILGGFPDNTYRPWDTTKRDQFSKLVVNTFKSDECQQLQQGNLVTSFFDVFTSSTLYVYVACAEILEMVNGFPDGSFHPSFNVKRWEAAKMLLNAKGVELPDEYDGGPIPSDVEDLPDEVKIVVQAVLAEGFMSGYDSNHFGPLDDLLRDQVAKMIYNAWIMLQ